MSHVSCYTLEKDNGDLFIIILGKMLVRNHETILNAKNMDTETFTEQIFLLTWIHTVSIVTQSKSLEPIKVLD